MEALEIPKIDKLKANVVCPVELSLRILGGKWRGSIMYQLRHEPLRFNVLMMRVQDGVVYYSKEVDHLLSSKVLAEHLDFLQECELVQKIEHDGVWYYALTQKGQSAIPLLLDLFKWGNENF